MRILTEEKLNTKIMLILKVTLKSIDILVLLFLIIS